jgi:DNA-binding response OmpR family regulator
VIFITASDRDETRKAALEAGCLAYLRKPFSGQSLVDAIREAVQIAA